MAVVALAGIGATLLAGKLERGHCERMARDARQQERLAEAYVRVLVLAEHVGHWAQMVEPVWDFDPPQPVRSLPELVEQAEAEAVVSAYGSDEVLKAFEAWRDIVRTMIFTVGLISREQADGRGHPSPSGSVSGSPYLTLHNLRPDERDARKALSCQIRSELRGRGEPESSSSGWLAHAEERAGRYLDSQLRHRFRRRSVEQPRRAAVSDAAQQMSWN